ncbi:hypothetical protein [Algibacter luteus]|uniref:hypothetical protein n=1 Tax=Algibacter luteus TaxID=1178825 RepID=UPI0025983B11|nr:hypothetical protein [Algibacter luteus]WJJ96574.1 hypothetical protein O5O44_15275 [Algibacter luteus]
MNKNILVSVFLIITLISCKKNEKLQWEYKYENRESSINMKILNGNNYLIYDKPTRTDFEWTNIDLKTSSIYGAGIKILGSENGITKTEINVPSNYLESDTLNIKLHFELDGKKNEVEFNIPVRKE